MSLWAIDLLKPFGQGWSRNGHQSFASLHHGLAKDRSAFGWSDLSWLKRMEEPWKNHVGTRTSTNLRPEDHKIRCFSVMQRQISIWIRSSCVSPRALGTSAGKVGIWWNFPIGFAYNISPIAPQVHKVLLTNMCAKESQHFIVLSFQTITRFGDAFQKEVLTLQTHESLDLLKPHWDIMNAFCRCHGNLQQRYLWNCCHWSGRIWAEILVQSGLTQGESYLEDTMKLHENRRHLLFLWLSKEAVTRNISFIELHGAPDFTNVSNFEDRKSHRPPYYTSLKLVGHLESWKVSAILDACSKLQTAWLLANS